MLIERTVTVDRSPAEVFAYLADFTTTMEWDPGTVRTTRVSGDGGVGTTYRNVSKFLGRETELTYVVTEHRPPELLELRGENKTVVAHGHDDADARADGGDDDQLPRGVRVQGLGAPGGAPHRARAASARGPLRARG